jgi:Domain of unknown function (DUF4328)
MNSDAFSGSRSAGRALLAAIVVRLVLSFSFLAIRFLPHDIRRSTYALQKWTLLFATIVVVVLHIVFVRAYFVALAATGRPTKQSPNFTIAGWFIPFANFVLPLLSVKQAYDAQKRSAGIAIGWWIAYLVFVLNNAVQFRVPYIGILIAVVVFGLWFAMVQSLIDASKAPLQAFAGAPGTYPSGHPGAMGAPNYPSAPPAVAFPPEWGWAWVHQKAGNLKVLGYYYRDKTAGFSVKMLVDLMQPMDFSQIAAAARAVGYRADTTIRLGGHETLNVEGLPSDFAAMMKAKYESGTSPAGPAAAIVLRLTKEECRVLGLPIAPPHMEVYV